MLLYPFLSLLLLLSPWATPPSIPAAEAATYGFKIHHRFSSTVRRWADSRSWDAGPWPEAGTARYFSALVEHDRVRRGVGRRLSGGTPGLTFSDGNGTIRINKLGFLHYAEVAMGTPSVSFLVALDTGSDLFWVPCDCESCAPTAPQNYGLNFEFSIYSPASSLTSKKVLCNSTLCERQSSCSGEFDICPYKVAYISTDTASSGILVEDVLYLTTEDTRQEAVEARVTFGCGQVQSGSFLDSAAPNGLFGLGMEKISVPSILAKGGLTSDSFSMCFGRDGIGRISFGDLGTSDQEETPFYLNTVHPTYLVRVTGILVGNASFNEEFSTLVDSGTSFTTLSDPAYTQLSKSFNAQVRDKPNAPDSQIPFEYCYIISSNQTEIPTMSLMMTGGSEFTVLNPIIFISTLEEVMYCLAIVKSSGNLNIIGQNFMTGLRVVFDRERLILGWKKFDCYDTEDSSTLPIKPRNSSMRTPPISTGANRYDSEAAKQNRNTSQVSIVQPAPSQSFHLDTSFFTHLLLTLLLVLLLIQ